MIVLQVLNVFDYKYAECVQIYVQKIASMLETLDIRKAEMCLGLKKLLYLNVIYRENLYNSRN